MRVAGIALAVLAASALPVRADGGVPVGQRDEDGLRVTVFASPVPLRAGAAEIGVLVQENGLPVSDASVTLSPVKTGGPSGERVRAPAWCAVTGPGGKIPATGAHSGNRLLKGAFLPLTESGLWELGVEVKRGDRALAFSIPLIVGPPARPLATWWPLIALVPAAIALYAARAALARRSVKASRVDNFGISKVRTSAAAASAAGRSDQAESGPRGRP